MSQPMRKCARKLANIELAKESAKVNEGSKAKEFIEVWQACESDYTVQVVMSVGRDVECAIMQDRVNEVEIEGLPSSWPVLSDSSNSDAMFKCATLPCKHRFYPCALALHFAASDMRCPVCREGHEKPLDVHAILDFYFMINLLMKAVFARGGVDGGSLLWDTTSHGLCGQV